MSDRSIIEAVGVYLENFRRSGDKYNFRCPYCGDSSKDPTKARAWLIPPRPRQGIDAFVYHCFNCNKSTNLERFLRDFFPSEYDDLIMDKYAQGDAKIMRSRQIERPLSEPLDFNVKLRELPRLHELPREHEAVRYCHERGLEDRKLGDVWYSERFEEWIEGILPRHGNYKKTSKRVVFPLRTRAGNVFGAQGRSIDGNRVRYKTFLFDEDRSPVYGLDKVNFNKRFYVFEGIIDSLFVPNSIAVCSSNLLGGLKSLNTISKNAVLVFDNQPKNLEITTEIREAVSEGFTVCIWPRGTRGKDVNDMIKRGLDEETLKRIIDDNSFSGLAAETAIIERKFIRSRRFDAGDLSL